MAISSAVGSERVSKVVGYKLKKGFFQTSSPNLPQRIAILGMVNTANESGLDDSPKEIISANEAGTLYGYGSMIHNIMRILRPKNSDGVGGIPTIVIPQVAAGGATNTVITATFTISSTATANATHHAVINGRDSIDGIPYAYSVVKGDTAAQIYVKAKNAINAVPGSPVIATNGGTPGSETSLILTSKWKGLSSAELKLRFDDGGVAAGITYSSSTSDGTGAIDIADALTYLSSNEWNTLVINPYGEETNNDIEDVNGIADPTNPTGRYSATTFKPFVSIFGSIEDDAATLGAITEARKAEMTCAVAPAPLSEGFTWEAAANMAYLEALTAQNQPSTDIIGQSYPDMPVPADGVIGDMGEYDYRDYLVQKGCSTVELVAGKYQVCDFVTTYHPAGEVPPAYRYVRNLILDWNVRYKYYLLELIYVVGKTITNDDQTVNVSGVIKPKDWKQQVRSLADDLSANALSADAQFMKDSITVGISSTNPDRFETFFRYKRTGTARIASTDAEAGFNFGIV